ncbi:hypothetical protein [Loktanella salsilacus]|uniref:hypothetical protein n=1 Tax=Loktanella salsilacus TaxID=195913 RepID=UPI0037041D71
MMRDNLKALRHPKAGAPTTQHFYCDDQGNTVLIANRFERGGGDKFFIPYDVAAETWTALDSRPLYRLPELQAANLDRPIIVTEGEKCADALTTLGFIATTTFGGSNAARKTDLTPLTGRRVIVWPDHDEPGQKYAAQIADTLHREFNTPAKVVPISDALLCKVMVQSSADPAVQPITLHKGWDAADAIAGGWGVTEINRLIALTLDDGPPPPEADDASVDVPLFEDADLWHSPDKTPFATIRRGDHFETFALGSGGFKRLLAYEYFQAKGKTPAAAKLDDLSRQYIGQALFEGETHPVFFRMGQTDEGFALDLGGADWSVIDIDAEGWRERPMGSPRFRRSPGMAALPRPSRQGADLDCLRPFVNVRNDDDFKLIVGWLLGALRPEGPYPLLILTGEQGSAKSTTAKVLRRLIDPAELDSRSFPGDERDLMIAAQNGHVLAFDNLSRIKPAMADALCRLATGGGFATRKLHSDADEVLFKATRPIILNGIPELAERPDLADRAISLNLPVISETRREYEADFWQRFEAARPAILGAILNAISGAMAALPSVRLAKRPRMADFAKWVTAAEQTLGWPQASFLSAYGANRKEAEEAALECNAVASAILTMIQAQTHWEGTTADLITYLRKRYPAITEGSDAFPRQPAAFGTELRRIAPLLRSRGVSVTHTRTGKERRRVIEVTLT